MHPRAVRSWEPITKAKKNKRLLRTTSVLAAVCLCLGVGTLFSRLPETQTVMSMLTADFQYDDTLGRLQFVSNILPESAMVFLSSASEEPTLLPTQAEIAHSWSHAEPWMEFRCIGDVSSCQSGEIMTVVKNRQDEYTVRILHPNGYESIYSGLKTVHHNEYDTISAGQSIGTAAGHAAFELRKDGLSVLPVFSVQK